MRNCKLSKFRLLKYEPGSAPTVKTLKHWIDEGKLRGGYRDERLPIGSGEMDRVFLVRRAGTSLHSLFHYEKVYGKSRWVNGTGHAFDDVTHWAETLEPPE